MNENKLFCCEGMKILIGNYLEDKIFTPLDGSQKSGYSFASRRIFFCPSCGKDFKVLAIDDRFEQLRKTKSNNPTACCKVMEFRIDPEDENPDYFQIYYQTFARRFFFSQSTDWRNGEPADKIYQEWDFYYCPWCGQKLPPSLLNQWLKTVQQKFGVTKKLPLETMLPQVREEF